MASRDHALTTGADYITARVEFDPNAGCWLWARGYCTDGYGAAGLKPYSRRAHRASYEVFCGPIGGGLHVLHRCDTPACVNPDHLFLGTRSDNMQDAAAKGRLHPKGGPGGERHSRAKLAAVAVAEIRARYVRNGRYSNSRALADQFGVSTGEVRDIVSRRRWSKS